MHETDDWTTQQWESWWDDKVEPVIKEVRRRHRDSSYEGIYSGEFADPDIRAGLDATNAGFGAASFHTTGQGAPQAFARVALATRQRFYDAWLAHLAEISEDPPPPDDAAGWEVGAAFVTLTLPNGNVVRQYEDGTVTDEYGNTVKDGDPAFGPPMTRSLIPLVIGGLVVGALVVVGVLIAGSGDDTPLADGVTSTVAGDVGPVTVTDPPQTSSTSATAQSPVTTVPTNVAAARITTVDYLFASHNFTLEVEGDGEALATSGDTKWYITEFTVDSPSGSFVVEAKWSRGEFRGRAFDSGRALIDGAEVTAEWTDNSRLEVKLEAPGLSTPATKFDVLLLVRMLNPDGSNGDDYESTHSWPSN